MFKAIALAPGFPAPDIAFCVSYLASADPFHPAVAPFPSPSEAVLSQLRRELGHVAFTGDCDLDAVAAQLPLRRTRISVHLGNRIQYVGDTATVDGRYHCGELCAGWGTAKAWRRGTDWQATFDIHLVS
jgi:hypothetical protein